MIPYSRQTVTQEDIDTVVRVLQSDFLTQGPSVPAFENAVSEYVGARYGVATCNATAALHALCLALGIKSGDEVWVPAISFVATANCARYCGATVSFIDVDEETGLLSPDVLRDRLATADGAGKLPELLIVMHLGGQSCAMEEIAELCHRYGVRVIEDAAHALGARYKNNPVGKCTYSAACVFSFHPVKPITSGEGGMVVCNDETLVRKLRLFASHGIERNPDHFVSLPKEDWLYEQQVLGFNFRMSDIHAALGLSQLSRLDTMVSARSALAKRYDEKLKNSDVRPLRRLPDNVTSHHLYVVRFPAKASRNRAFRKLRESGYGVNLHYMPIPNHPYYRHLSSEHREYRGANIYADTALSLPLYQSMEETVVDSVVSVIESVL